jgi:hypothetical protein
MLTRYYETRVLFCNGRCIEPRTQFLCFKQEQMLLETPKLISTFFLTALHPPTASCVLPRMSPCILLIAIRPLFTSYRGARSGENSTY